MKILIINDKYDCGGAENHARLEKHLLEQKGHNVKYFTLDINVPVNTSYEMGHKTICRVYTKIQALLYRYITDRRVFRQLKNELTIFKPEVIHLHNIYLSSKAVYRAVRGWRCIQTVHDYSIVCVKSTCCDCHNYMCEGIKNGHCLRKCFTGGIKERITFLGRYIALKSNNRLRRQSVQQYISPSQCLTNYCNAHGFPTVCINNPLDTTGILSHKEWNPNAKKIFLYFGAVSRVKGIIPLIAAFCEFAPEKNVELQIIGTIKPELKKEFTQAIQSSSQIRYLGMLPHEEMLDKLREVHTVIVPSLWIENYPTTVLEAMAAGCVVLASDRGGMPEMISDPNCLFDVLDQSSIISCLEYAIKIPENLYEAITITQRKWVTENNSVKRFYRNIDSSFKGGHLIESSSSNDERKYRSTS